MVASPHIPVNLINKSVHKVLEQITISQYLTCAGMLNTPQTSRDMTKVIDIGGIWALDNGCFTEYEPYKILALLHKWRGASGCLFAVLPDVVGDHDSTLLLCNAWLGTYQSLGYPPAFVLQNGVTMDAIPFDSIAAVFVGGDDWFKKQASTMAITHEAHRRGLWVHWGRVGGLKRYKTILRDGWIDSFDSTGFSVYPPKIRKWLPYQLNRQANFL